MSNTPSINSYLQGALLAQQQIAQFEQILASRQQRTQSAQQFPMQQKQMQSGVELNPLRKRQLELGIETGEQGLLKSKEELSGLKLTNERLRNMMKQFTDPKALDELRKGVEGIGLTPEEKAGFDIAIQESAQSMDFTPARTYVKDIILERGRNRRSDTQQTAVEERLNKSIEAADKRFFAGLAQRQTQFEERRGTEEDAKNFAGRVATGEMTIGEVPRDSRAAVLRSLGSSKIIPAKIRGELGGMNAAEAATDQFEKTLTQYLNSKSPADAIRLRAQREGFTRILGRALGEKGVFTDYDKADFARVLGPGLIISTASPELAYQQIQDVRDLLNGVRQRKLEGYFKTFSNKPGTDPFDRLP